MATSWNHYEQRRRRLVIGGEIDVVSGGSLKIDGTAVISDTDTALLDFSSMTLTDGARVLRGSSLDFEAVTGWIAFSGNTEQDAFRYSAYFQPQTSASGKLLGIGNTAILQSGADVNLAEAAQLHILVQSGATAADRNSDATAGFHSVWAKVGGDVGSTWESGVRVAPIWSDLQINGSDVSSDESYLFLATTGSNINSLIRFESGGAHANYFLNADNGLGSGFLASSGYDTTQSNDPSGFLTVNLNGTLYGIPLMGAS